jgi:hypothetical protein
VWRFARRRIKDQLYIMAALPVVEFSFFDKKNSVEATCLIIRFPRLSIRQIAPRRDARRFANLLLNG